MTNYNFDSLWDEFNDKLLNYIKSKVSNQHDAEDILQNVFIKIYKNVENVENSEALKSWIYRITKNTVIDFYKKKKDVSVEPETLHFIEDETEEADNMNEEVAGCLSGILFELPGKYQEVFDMYEKQSMKHKEIAEALDITVSASKVRLKRAKEMFKDKLLKCCDFEVDAYGNVLDYKPKSDCADCNGDC